MLESLFKILQSLRGYIFFASVAVAILMIVFLVAWALNYELEYRGIVLNPEPIYIITNLVFATLSALHRKLIDRCEFSPAEALAIGYGNNFLRPLLTSLIAKHHKIPTVIIYRPNRISDLQTDNIQRMKAELKGRKYSLEQIGIEDEQGRIRDILTVKKTNEDHVYFDFPSTLLTLSPYIDFKVASTANNSSSKQKLKLGEDLIGAFYTKLDEVLEEANLAAYVNYCGNSLNLHDSSCTF